MFSISVLITDTKKYSIQKLQIGNLIKNIVRRDFFQKIYHCITKIKNLDTFDLLRIGTSKWILGNFFGMILEQHFCAKTFSIGFFAIWYINLHGISNFIAIYHVFNTVSKFSLSRFSQALFFKPSERAKSFKNKICFPDALSVHFLLTLHT